MTEEQINELKQKYGSITTVIIPYETGEFTFYCKKPDKVTRKMISKLASGELPERAIIAGFNALRVAGNDVKELEACKDEDAMITAEDALIEILKVQKAIIKKN